MMLSRPGAGVESFYGFGLVRDYRPDPGISLWALALAVVCDAPNLWTQHILCIYGASIYMSSTAPFGR